MEHDGDEQDPSTDEERSPSDESVSFTVTEAIDSILRILIECDPVGLTPAELAAESNLPLTEGGVNRILAGFEARELATETNGYWSVSDNDIAMSARVGKRHGERAMNDAEWAEYDDNELEALAGIGES